MPMERKEGTILGEAEGRRKNGVDGDNMVFSNLFLFYFFFGCLEERIP